SYQAGAPADTAESSRRGQHRRDDAGKRRAAAQRARVFGGHGEEEAWFLADHFESGRRRPPLPHRDASRSLNGQVADGYRGVAGAAFRRDDLRTARRVAAAASGTAAHAVV